MGKKKTAFVWVLLVLIGLVVVLEAAAILLSLSDPSTLVSFDGITTIISIILLTILFFKLYNVRPDVLTWVHLSIGFFVLTLLIGIVLAFFTLGILGIFLAFFGTLFPLLVAACFWIGITIHIKRAKRENLMEFS